MKRLFETFDGGRDGWVSIKVRNGAGKKGGGNRKIECRAGDKEAG